MFEIPDDDEHLFDDIPLDDITNKKTDKNQPANCRPQLRVPESLCTGNATKQLYSGDDRAHREFNLSPEKSVSNHINKEPNSVSTRVSPDETNRSCNGNRRSINPGLRAATPVVSTRTVTVNKPAEGQVSSSLITSVGSATDHITPKRKRKFPGPAGLLPPKMVQGKGIDIQSVVTPDRTPQHSAATPEGREPGVSSSQSSEDVFSDVPWQALLTDLGDEGVKLMKKFSIGCTLLKASKKQLYQGKAVLLCGVIEMIESHGSEASITLRDRSGKMQGTVHRDLLKEYEVELQISTVLVLKQVSIISLSNRNHYLNITPSNLVCLYHSRQDKLTTLKFHGSQESLRSVLAALEKKAASRKSMDASLTPRSSTGSSAASLSGRSSTGTPVLQGSFPTTPDLNQRLSRPGTPYSAHSSSRLTTPADVRDVSVVIPSNMPVTPSGIAQTGSDGLVHNSRQIYAPAGRLSSLLCGKSLSLPGNTPGIPHTPGYTSIGTCRNGFENQSNSRSDSSSLVGRGGNLHNSSVASLTTPQASSSWSFKKTSTTVQHVTTPATPSLASHSTNRSCQLSVSKPSIQNMELNTQTSSKSKWSFKSRTSTSPNSTIGSPVVLQKGSLQDSKSAEKSVSGVVPTEDLWDDDLNDEILSQLSDDMA